MFMHGGIAHIAGNMLYLWIFGDNIENALGHLRYLAFYLVCGVLASLAHVFTMSATHGDMLVPSLGASGAISERSEATCSLPGQARAHDDGEGHDGDAGVGVDRRVVPLPGRGGHGAPGGGSQAGGVAYAAHVGGFVAGVILVKAFAAGQQVPRLWRG